MAGRQFATDDLDLVTDLTNSLRVITAAVTTFCNGFQGYIESPDSIEHHNFFAKAAKEVVHNLCSTDSSKVSVALTNLVKVADFSSELRVKR